MGGTAGGTAGGRRDRVRRGVDRVVTVAALGCPLFLVHGRGVAEALIDVSAAGLVLRSVLGGGWHWLQASWVRVAALWWGWLLVCSVPVGPFGAGGWGAFGQAAAAVRFLLFAAALPAIALRGVRERRVLRVLLVTAVLYIAGQMALQAVIGHNLWGNPRFGDGTLTGPYNKPRAAAPLSRLLLPVVLLAAAALGSRSWRGGFARSARIAAPVLPLLAGVAVMVLAGQRMPLLLFVFGLAVSGLMLPRLRGPLAGVVLAAPVLVAVSAALTPASFHHLVLLFARQMEHFRHSPYGLVFARAAEIGWLNPGTGLGFDGFRHGCADPVFFHPWPPWGAGSGEGGGAAICVQHPHNHYLQALDESGVPGVGLFAAMVLSWLLAIGRGLSGAGASADARVRAWRVGLFAAVFIQEWPIASTSDFTNMPLGGWFFLLLGMALAEADADMRRRTETKGSGPCPT